MDNFDVYEWNKKRYLNEGKEELESIKKDLEAKYPHLDFRINGDEIRVSSPTNNQQDLANFGRKIDNKEFGQYKGFHDDKEGRGEIVRIIRK
jgi:hypothetical protein